MTERARARLARCSRAACVLEAWARKPGNVHRERDFPDLRYADFLCSADAVAPVLAEAPKQPLGHTILMAIRATRAAVATNTNLGIVLLLAPLCQTAGDSHAAWPARLETALSQTTAADAADAYQAIRLAAPGGMGKVENQDVASEPTVSLRAAMRLAADRDLVARQYANGFAEVFGFAVPALEHALQTGLPPEEAIVFCQLRMMAAFPDTLIARQRGAAVAAEAAARAAELLPPLAMPGGFAGGAATAEFDAWLRSRRANPGTTADFACAALFVSLWRGNAALVDFADRTIA